MKKNLGNKNLMKNIKIAAGLLAVTALTIPALAGCSSGKSSSSASTYELAASSTDYNGMGSSYSSASYASADYDSVDWEATQEEAAYDSAGSAAKVEVGEESSAYQQKLIKNYFYNFNVEDFAASMEFINGSIAKFGGYMETSEVYGSEYPDAYLVIRIPTSNVDAFIESVGSIGEMTYQSVSTEDITLSYYDTEARLESLRAQHDRLIELINKAETLTDIAQLEAQLSNVEYEINSYQSQIKVWDNKVDYTTFTINIDTITPITIVEQDGFFTRIRKGFLENTEGAAEMLANFVIGIITYIPYLVIYVIFGVLIWLISIPVRKCLKKWKEKRAAKRAEKMGGSAFTAPFKITNKNKGNDQDKQNVDETQ